MYKELYWAHQALTRCLQWPPIFLSLTPSAYDMITEIGWASATEEKAFVHAVMEGTMAQSEAGRSPAEGGVGIIVLILTTP